MRKNHKKSDILKALVQAAKERMATGEYTQDKTNNGKFKLLKGGLRAEYKLVLKDGKEELNMYNKVCSILSKDEFVSNPISQLIDQAKFNTLSCEAKERYVLTLAEKFREMKDRYESENLA